MNLFLWIIICIVIIVILHNLFYFFKDTLTNPITKDFVKKPNATINEVEEIIKNKNEKVQNEQNMKEELKLFFKDLKDNTPENSSSISENLNFSFSKI